jgi:hypothetical protein
MLVVDTSAGAAGEQAPDRIKVFRFVPREGWLPYDKEGLRADRLGEDTARR